MRLRDLLEIAQVAVLPFAFALAVVMWFRMLGALDL